MHIFSLIPDAVWLVNEDQILVLRVNHLAHVVQVHVLKQHQDLHAVDSMRRSGQCTLSTILHVHVVVIVTVPVALKGPSAAILELLGDLSLVPIVGHPLTGWPTIRTAWGSE